MITSTSNPQVKNLQLLKKKSGARNEQNVFLVEGMKMYQEAPRGKIKKVYISKSLYQEKGQAFLQGIETEVLDDHVFLAASDTKTPQGLLCVVEQFHYLLEDMLQKKNPHLLLLENLQDPGNVGTIMRTAEGAGADGIILSRTSVDLYHPKTIRSTMGSIYRMPFLYVNSLEEILPILKKQGIRTYAAHLQGKNCYDQEDYRKGFPQDWDILLSAFVLGESHRKNQKRLPSKKKKPRPSHPRKKKTFKKCRSGYLKKSAKKKPKALFLIKIY